MLRIVFLLFFFSFTLQGADESSLVKPRTLYEAIKEASLRVDDNKFYPKPGMIYLSPYGIFLNLDDRFIPLNSLFVDEKGIYGIIPDNTNAWICLFCGAQDNKSNWTSCWACGRPKAVEKVKK